MSAMRLENLSYVYRSGRGVRDVNLEVRRGEVFGFLGPNGAGKTTLIRTVLGFLHPRAGRAQVLGLDALRQSREVRRKTGYLPSDPALYDFLTGAQNIDLSLTLRGVRNGHRVKELADRLEIDLKRRVKVFSRGNRQKVAIIAALAHDPEFLILDEPTSGLDPLVQDTFGQLLKEEQARGKTTFMSSHVLSEVEALCDRVGVIKDGQIITVDTVLNLKKQRVKYVSCEFAGTAPDLSQMAGIADLQVDGSRVRFTINGSLDRLIAALARTELVDLTVENPPLEEVFRAFYAGGGGGR